MRASSPAPAEDISVSITRDMCKCILCRRCVTVCNEIQGVGVLNAQNRGFETVIAPAMELPLGTATAPSAASAPWSAPSAR